MLVLSIFVVIVGGQNLYLVIVNSMPSTASCKCYSRKVAEEKHTGIYDQDDEALSFCLNKLGRKLFLNYVGLEGCCENYGYPMSPCLLVRHIRLIIGCGPVSYIYIM